MRVGGLIVLVAAFAAVPCSRASAQTDFSGTWTLDRDISSDLTKASFEPPKAPAQRNTSGFSGGFGGRGFGGGSRRGGGGGGNGGGGGSRNDGAGRASAPLTPEEQTRLRELADFVRSLSAVGIEHTDHSTFTVTDVQKRSHLFPTDGTKTPLALGTTSVDTVTNWDGPHMVTIVTVGPMRDLVFTYTLVPATKQMALRIRLDEGGRARADLPELRLVYKRTS